MKAKVFLLTLLFASYSINGVSQGIMEVHDSQSILQNALQFVKQWAEMVEQGADQAEQLSYEIEERAERLQKVKEEIDDITKLSKKIVVLYREIENCNTKLENIRKNLIRSNYMSVEEKYTIYSRAQNLCYDILKRKSAIDEVVKDSKTYSRNKSAMQKAQALDEVTDMVRHISKCLDVISYASIDLINYKKESLEMDYALRQCYSLKLY